MIIVPLRDVAAVLLWIVITLLPDAAVALTVKLATVFVPPLQPTKTTELVATKLFVKVITYVPPPAVVSELDVITPD